VRAAMLAVRYLRDSILIYPLDTIAPGWPFFRRFAMAETTFPSGMVIRSHPWPKGFDPLKASDQELLRHGVPPRPKDPTLRSEWENLMKSLSRSTFIEPKFRRTDRQHGPVIRFRRTDPQHGPAIRSDTQTWPAWSGGVVYLPTPSPAGAKFYVVSGRWTVPSPMPSDADDQVYVCACWVGIDGDNGPSGSQDILQAGITCEAQFDGSAPNGVVQAFFPWWEWFPENEVVITNLALSIGDSLVCNIVANSSTTASIVLANLTTNQTAACDVTAPTGTALVGDCVEWIVERPTFGGVLQQLANYDTVTFQEAFGGNNLPGDDAVRDPSQGDAINMTGDNGALVSTATVAYRQVNCLSAGII